MRSALAVSPQRFDVIPGTVAGVKRAGWFETAEDTLAIWHNGFLEANYRLDRILDYLDGDADALNGLRSVRRP